MVAVADRTRLASAQAAVAKTVEQLDQTCSRFRDDSELSALNGAAGSWTQVSPLLFDAIRASLRAAALTDGDVDPTIGRALIALGYDRDFEAIAGHRRAVAFAAVPGWRAVELDSDRTTIRLEPGVVLDLGATAKALGADLAAARAAAAAQSGALVGLSGDISMAGAPPAGGWRLRVTDDHRSGVQAPGQWISLETGGLATSSVAVRRWRSAGFPDELHHLIDPRTGRPANAVWRTVSVAARSCLDANIASTAAIIRGGPALAWLEALELPSRLVGLDGSVHHIAGWPAEGDDLPLASDRQTVAKVVA